MISFPFSGENGMSGHARLFAHGNAIHAPFPWVELALKASCGL
jgi:hypothetical protein